MKNARHNPKRSILSAILPTGETETPASASPLPRQTKQAQVVDLLGRSEGASIADIVAATGWQPHTSRAALTGLRKKGHSIAAEKADGVTRYRIVAA